MTLVLYIVLALALVALVSLLVLYQQCRDPGYLIMAVLAIASALLSFHLLAWWPLILGVVLVGLLMFYGTCRT